MRLIILNTIKQSLLYNAWANQVLLNNLAQITDEDYCKSLPTAFHSLHGLMLHLYYYDTKSFHKITEIAQAEAFNKKMDREALAQHIMLYSNNWVSWINNLITSESPLVSIEKISKDIMDLTIHNSYHRGQINEIVTYLGYKPDSLDIYVYHDTAAAEDHSV